MQRVPILVLSVCLALACAVAAIQTYEKRQVDKLYRDLLLEREELYSQKNNLEKQVGELISKRSKEIEEFQATELEYKNALAQKEKTISEQEEVLKEMGSFRASLDQVKLEQANHKDWREAIEEQGQLVAFLGEKLQGSGMGIYRQDPYVVVQIPQTTFQFGSTQASKALLEGLKVVSDVVKAYNGTYLLAVEGHTDNMPLKKDGAYRSNWELGAARADRVIQNLLRLGVDPKDIALVSRSEYMPVNAHQKPTEDEANRRIELVFAPRRMVVKQENKIAPTSPQASPSIETTSAAALVPPVENGQR